MADIVDITLNMKSMFDTFPYLQKYIEATRTEK